jgi:hypothetical protein
MPGFLRCLNDNHEDLDDEALKLYREAEERALSSQRLMLNNLILAQMLITN